MNSELRRSLSIISFIYLAGLAGAFNPSGAAAQSGASAALDTSRLPRVSGANQIYASPATTIFTTPITVAQTAATTSGNSPPLPIPAGATEVTYDKKNGRLNFSSATGVKALTDFYTCCPPLM